MKNEFYSIEEFRIDDVPVENRLIKSLALFLDIDKLGIQLDCIFNDQINMKTTKPIKMGETITLTIVDRWEKRFRKKFILTAFNVISENSLRDVDVNLKAVSEIGFTSMSQRVASSYEGTPSDLVKQLLGDVEITQTDNVVQLLSPGWTRTKFIEHLSRLAYSKVYGGMFLCWEDFDSVKFKSLNDIFKNQKTVNSFLTNNRNAFYRYNIIEHKEFTTGNFSKSSNGNQFNRTYASYDPDTKQLVTKSVKLADDGKDFNRLGKGQNFSDVAMEMQGVRPILVGHFDEGTMQVKYENQMRFSEFDNRMHIMVNGDFTNNPGTLINIDAQARYEQTEFDVAMGGLWLIEKVACHFVGQDFIQKIQVTRNASYNYDSKNSKVVNPKVSSSL